MPAAFQAWQEDHRNAGGFMAAPRGNELNDWHHDKASGFDMGTLYTMVAGLLNVLVIYDAYAGPLPPPVTGKRKSDDPPDDSDADESGNGPQSN